MKSFLAIAVLAILAVTAALPAPKKDTTEDASTTSSDETDMRWQDCSIAAIQTQKECMDLARQDSSVNNCQENFNAEVTRCNVDYPYSYSVSK
ncbi:hypothetical protein BGZ81_008253 [Podila clonocystis]|nr:hypothetical protein BGZ81_008253 [Podila clonocystis]